jgi:hypothetical protein
MSRSRSTMTGLVIVAASAGLALAGCHSSSGSASGAATASAAGTAKAVATASSAASGSVAVGGAGSVAYFPDQVGDTWVYSVQFASTKATVTERVTAVTQVSDGTEVTMSDVDTAVAAAKPTTIQWIVHPDGSISIPTDFIGGSTLKLKSGNLGWPGPAQLASGQPQASTIVMAETVDGKTVTVTAKSVVKGDGTQSVSVPAGSYSATVIDDVENEKVLGYPVTSDVKIWLANGVGPVKTEMTSGSGGTSALSELEQLVSFTKG